MDTQRERPRTWWMPGLAALALATAFLPAARAAEVDVAAAISGLPGQDHAAATRVCEELLQGGAPALEKLVGLLVEPGKGDDTKARYALHGLIIHASAPGREAQRKLLADTLIRQLGADRAPAVKGFLIRQLQLAGGQEAIEPISRFLVGDENMCEYAAQALQAIGGEKAVAALRAALPKAQGPCRLTILQALGIERDAESLPAELDAARDQDRDVRLTGLAAAGKIGSPAATDTLKGASTPESLYERGKATDALLSLAQRLVDADKKADAEAIYRYLWTTRTDVKDRHVRCAALLGLVAACGEKATDDVLAALKDQDYQVRAAAAQAIAILPGQAMTLRLVESLKDAPPAARADTLGLLARRKDKTALPAALEAAKDPDKSVRKAGLEAAAALGGEEAIPVLLAALAAPERDVADVARAALAELPGDETAPKLVAALPAVPPQARATLLGVLAARDAKAHLEAVFACTGDQDEGVRAAALEAIGALGDPATLPRLLGLVLAAKGGRERSAGEKAADSICLRARDKGKCVEAVLAVLPKAEPGTRAALLGVLGGTGSPKALEALRAAVKDADAQTQDAAVRALAERWPDAAAADDLLALAQNAGQMPQRSAALRGYLRIVALPSKRPAADTLKMYALALKAAPRPEEKKEVLDAIGEVKDMGALDLASGCLADESVLGQAEVVVLRLCDRLRDTKDQAALERLRAAVQSIIATTKEPRRKENAQKVLGRFPKK